MNIEELVHIENIKKEVSKGCEPFGFWMQFAVPISQVLLQVNCSANLFIYCMLNKRFREALKSCVMKCVKKCPCICGSVVIDTPKRNSDTSIGECNRVNLQALNSELTEPISQPMLELAYR